MTRGETKVQVNMRLPKAHVDRLNQLRVAAGFMTQAEFVSRLIDEEWARREGEMNKMSNRIAVRQTRKGDWLVYETVHGWKTGQQFARFEEQGEAEQYAAELRADLRRKEKEIEVMINRPRPTVETSIAADHPSFWTITGTPLKYPEHGDWLNRPFLNQIAAELDEPDYHMMFINSEMVVTPDYGSPYRFGRHLRDLVGDENAGVMRHTPSNIYYTWHNETAAFYDPAKRSADETPFQRDDWYSAVDGLMEGETA